MLLYFKLKLDIFSILRACENRNLLIFLSTDHQRKIKNYSQLKLLQYFFLCFFSFFLASFPDVTSIQCCFELNKSFIGDLIKGTKSSGTWKGEKWNKHEKCKRETTINNTRSQTKSSPLMLVRWRKNILNSHVNSFGISFFDCFFPPNWSIVYSVLVSIMKMFTDFLWSQLGFEDYSKKFHATLCVPSRHPFLLFHCLRNSRST